MLKLLLKDRSNQVKLCGFFNEVAYHTDACPTLQEDNIEEIKAFMKQYSGPPRNQYNNNNYYTQKPNSNLSCSP
ncbi:hypothetical protein Scep_007269 [Stephania cephalantha]|uniref:Uncharacterized protein n=1 Tax=Stephania cephalantha TaxID=152367 RepID=A0AAP0K9R1_9MAGN